MNAHIARFTWALAVTLCACSDPGPSPADAAASVDTAIPDAPDDARASDAADAVTRLPDASTDASHDAAPDALPDALSDASPDASPDASAPRTDASDDRALPPLLAGTYRCGGGDCSPGEVCVYYRGFDPPRGSSCQPVRDPEMYAACAAPSPPSGCEPELSRNFCMGFTTVTRGRNVTCCGDPTSCSPF